MQYEPQVIENNILKFWEEKKIFQKLMKLRKGKKKYSFLDGPITSNNPMGVHHAWGRVLKDLYQRFKAMQGFDQRYQNGFDCQGLWIEVEVEKELGFKSKKDIEKFGIENFSKACKERVNKFTKKQTEQSIRLGQWMNWKNSYYTCSDKNIEAIWYFLKLCHDKGWLYKGTRVLPWCIRCGTSSSKHEMSDEGWAELTHPGLFVKFPLKGRDKEYLLVWTTTAWTLSSNVAAAVHPELDYVKVKIGDEFLYLSEGAKKCLDKEFEVVEKLKGKDLIGLEYESLYSNFDAQKDVKHRVVEWKEVNEEEGTGIVHIAPGCGEEDQELGKVEDLKEIAPLDEFGNFMEGFGWLTGKNVSNIANEIINDLKKRNLLYKVEDYKHRYPVCWRCKEQLVFRLGKEWFIKSDEIRPLMKKEAKKVKWYPEFTGKIMQDWLDNMGDWNISRKRYWGLPLMFFECECGNLEIIGSLKELKEKAVNKKIVNKLPELHRPWIDEVKIKCSKCGKKVERIKEVGDCWLDAGIVPYSTMGYFDNREFWKSWFPPELISEYISQIKLWYYALLFMSITLEGVTPYKSVLTTMYVVDEKGDAMHKSAGNVIWFDEAVEKMGADVMRWLYVRQNPKFNLKFGYNVTNEVQRVLNVLYNTVKFMQTYMEANKMKPSQTKVKDPSNLWLLSRIQTLKEDVTSSMEELKPHVASNFLEDFFLNDLSRWYGQIIRDEIKPDVNSEIKEETLNIFYKVNLELLKLLSPFIPFVTESLYQDYFKKFEKTESIHLTDWPEIEKKYQDKKLEDGMEMVKKIVEFSNSKRHEKEIKLRYKLKKLTVNTKDENLVKDLSKVIEKMANVESVEIKKADELTVELDTEHTPELKEEWLLSELTRKIQASRKKMGFRIEDKVNLYLDDYFKKHKKRIEKTTGTKIKFGKIEGKKFQLVFDEIEIVFGIK